MSPQDAMELPSSQNTINTPAGAQGRTESWAVNPKPSYSKVGTKGSRLQAFAKQTLFGKSSDFQKDDSKAAGGQLFDFILFGSMQYAVCRINCKCCLTNF